MAQALHFQMPALVFSKQTSHTQMFTYPTTQKSKGEGATRPLASQGADNLALRVHPVALDFCYFIC